MDLIELGKKLVSQELVVIKNNKVQFNTQNLKDFVDIAEEKVEDSIKNELSDVPLKELKKKIADTYKAFNAVRVSVTSEFDKGKGLFTVEEKRLKSLIIPLDKRIQELNEEVFKIAEKAIKDTFNSLQAENKELNINLTVFDHFINSQRKNKGMLPNEKTNILSKSSSDKILAEFNKVADPLREQLELKKREKTESLQFEEAITKFNISSQDISILKDIIEEVEAFKSKVNDLFPLTAQSCLRALDSKIQLINATIRGIEEKAKREEAQKEAEKAKREAEKLANLDFENMERVAIIEENISDNPKIEDLEGIVVELRKIYPLLKMSKNQTIVSELANSINNKINNLQKQKEESDNQKKEEVVKAEKKVLVRFEVCDTLKNCKAVKKFMVDNNINYKSI